MKQEAFVRQHGREWDILSAWLEQQRKRGKPEAGTPAAGLDVERFPHAYRRVCQQLALAQARGYSPALVARLQGLVQEGHRHLYRARRPEWRAVRRFAAADFPRLVRAEWRYMLASALLLYVPMLAMIWLIHHKPELVYSVYSPEDVAQYEKMYDPAEHADRLARDSETDLAMFGFYILNNVSIGFRTMAGGLFAGVGTLLVLLMNGLMIGAVAGHLTQVGFGSTFWSFVVGHSSLELTAIVISGGAGLRLGFALLAPGRDARGVAVAEAARVSARLVLGAFLMLVLAAFVESYWSSQAWMPVAVKYTAGGCLWLAVLTWLYVGGRREA